MNNTKKGYSKFGIIALCSFIYFVSYFSRKDFAAVMAGMITENVIDKTLGGFIGMGLFICYGAGQLISGYLGDKISPNKLILFGLGTTMACNLAMPLITIPSLMIPVWALNGLAQAMLWPPIVRILSDNLKSEDFVTSNLVVTTAAHIATILLYLYVPVCLEFMSWKAVFFTATVMALLAIVIIIVCLGIVLPKNPTKAESETVEKIDTDTAEASEKSEISYLSLILKGGIIPLFGAIVMMGFLRDGIESWLPTLYSEVFNRDASESILISVLLPIFSILSLVVIKVLHKNKLFNNEAMGTIILFATSMLACIPIYFLLDAKLPVLRVICLVLAAFVCSCSHAINFMLISCLPGRFSVYHKAATTSGFCNAFTYVGAAISMYGFAAISKAFGWNATVISWIIISGIGLLLTLASVVKYTKFIKN